MFIDVRRNEELNWNCPSAIWCESFKGILRIGELSLSDRRNKCSVLRKPAPWGGTNIWSRFVINSKYRLLSTSVVLQTRCILRKSQKIIIYRIDQPSEGSTSPRWLITKTIGSSSFRATVWDTPETPYYQSSTPTTVRELSWARIISQRSQRDTKTVDEGTSVDFITRPGPRLTVKNLQPLPAKFKVSSLSSIFTLWTEDSQPVSFVSDLAAHAMQWNIVSSSIFCALITVCVVFVLSP